MIQSEDYEIQQFDPFAVNKYLKRKKEEKRDKEFFCDKDYCSDSSKLIMIQFFS